MKKHKLFTAYQKLPQNARVCMMAEPLNTVPYNLYKPYFSRYMLLLGITKMQIGAIGSINMLMHMIAALLSTVLVDKLGRKRATIVVDLIGWVLPCAVWAIAQDFTMFVIGTLLGACWRISNNAWNCLIVEQAKPEELLPIFSWLNAVSQAAVFVTPVAGLLVAKLGLVFAMKILLWVSFAMMLSRIVILLWGCKETEQGKERRNAVRGQSIVKMMADTLSSLRWILHSKGMMMCTLFVLLLYSNKLLYDTYFPLLLTETIGLPDAALSIFPVLRAAASIGVLALLAPNVQRIRQDVLLVAGLSLGVLCFVGMTFLPKGSYLGAVLSFLLQGAMLAIIDPLVNALLAIHIPADQRARIVGLVWMIVHGLCIPLSYAMGALSTLDMRAPFWMTAGLFVVGMVFIMVNKSSVDLIL